MNIKRLKIGTGLAIACAALTQACTTELKKTETAPFSQGAPVVVPAGAPGSQGGTAAPAAPTATATAPKANISGPSIVVTGDVFTLSASASDAGGGTLTYSWTLGAGFAFYPDEASQKTLAAPQIKALTPQMTTTISVAVTNAAGSNSASLAMRIDAAKKFEAKGGSHTMAAANGGTVTIQGRRILSSLGETSFALPTAPPRVLVIDPKYFTNVAGSDLILDDDDICEALQRIEPNTQPGNCSAGDTPPLYDAVELKTSGNISLTRIDVNLAAFYNEATGLNIREFRISSNVTATESISLRAPDVVVNGELRTGAGFGIDIRASDADRGTGSVFIAKPLVTLGDDVLLRANGQLVVGGDITTTGSTVGGAVTIGTGTTPRRILLLGSIVTSGAPGATTNTAGAIQVGVTSTPVVQFPFLREINVTGGAGSTATGSGGTGGRVVVTATGTGSIDALVDLSNVKIVADGGEEAAVVGGGNGGPANVTTPIDLFADNPGGGDATVVVGRTGESAVMLSANGGNGANTPGNGGRIYIRANSTRRAQVVGLGGLTTANGGSNNTPGTTTGARAAGQGGEISLEAYGSGGANAINWNGNLMSVGGDSILYTGSGALIGAPGVQGVVKIKTANGNSGEISVNGDLIARRGKGAYNPPAGIVACTNTLFVDVDAAANSSGSVRLNGNIDTRGGLDVNNGTYIASPADTAANNDFTAASGGAVSVLASGNNDATINVKNITTKGGEGDGGGDGCTVVLQSSSNGVESISYGAIDASGGQANKLLGAGDGAQVSIFGRNSYSDSFQVSGGAVTTSGGNHTGVGNAVPSVAVAPDGGDAAPILITDSSISAKNARLIDVNVGNLSAAGGTVAGRADVARSGGDGDYIYIRLGETNNTVSTQLVTGTINTNGASGPATGVGVVMTTGIAGGAGGEFLLEIPGARDQAIVDIKTGAIDTSGASAAVAANNMLSSLPAGGRGGNVTIHAQAPGRYEFGAINQNSGNGQFNAALNGANFAFDSESGEVVTAVFGAISVNAGGGNDAGNPGGNGGDIEFTIPSPITISTGQLSANAGTPGAGSGGLGFGGYIHHEGPFTPSYIVITCTGSPGLAGNSPEANQPACIDNVFTCSAGLGARVCGDDNYPF
jgi:hypothetical protein